MRASVKSVAGGYAVFAPDFAVKTESAKHLAAPVASPVVDASAVTAPFPAASGAHMML